MRFLLKSAFMIFLLLLVVPFFAPFLLDKPLNSERSAMPGPQEIGGAVSAARGTIEYMSGICEDKPEVCEDGAGILSFLGSRARQGAEIVYIYLGQHFGDNKTTEEKQADDTYGSTNPAPLADHNLEAERPPQDMVTTGAIAETNTVSAEPSAPKAVQPPGPVPDAFSPDISGISIDVPIPTRRPR